MKTRFNTIDIRATLAELRKRFLGMRVANIYDIDNKTFLIKLAKPDLKTMILLESGNKIHSTEFEWPKNMTPSGFSMKLRKHLRTRRLESVEQLGIDRIVDLQFGSGEAAYHIILELYDRGNIVLTDFEYNIMNILRQRTDESQDVRFAVREKYPVELAKQPEGPVDIATLNKYMLSAKEGDNLKKILNPHLVYGPAVIEHSLLTAGIPANARLGYEFKQSEDMDKLMAAIEEAERLLTLTHNGTCKGYVIQKKEKKATFKDGEPQDLLVYHEFHPFLFKQHEHLPYVEFDIFDKAVDEFFAKMESQKLDVKALQQEKVAIKKLENVKKDHEKRLQSLKSEQDTDKMRAQLIESNLTLVDNAIRVIQSALANQIDWTEIEQIVKEAQAQGDPVAGSIKTLKLNTNHITLLLREPGSEDSDSDERSKPMKIDIDLSLSAYANARKFYDMKKHAAKKEQKTVDASGKALKSAEKKTKQTLKEVSVLASINKARKTYWFEKFLWFISSENYLIIGGRDQQQNEMIVKRYLTVGDLYVHADLHGASSVIIKNPSGKEVPPKTLTEAGTMAVCNSAAWDAKVVTSAWWVKHDQVSKTAPTGEYLTTGSFMIRGRKNYLPPCYLVYGFGFLFKLDEDSLYRHKNERRVRTTEEEEDVTASESVTLESQISELSIETQESDHEENSDSAEDQNDEDEEDAETKLEDIEETEEDSDERTKCDKEDEDELQKEDIKEENGLKDCDKGNVKEEVEEAVQKEQEEEIVYPDTSIQLQHVKGDKYTLQRNVSQSSEVDERIFFGDDTPVTLGTKIEKTGAKMSAKQRREMKKATKQQKPQVTGTDTENEPSDKSTEATEEQKPSCDEQPEPPGGVEQQLEAESENGVEQAHRSSISQNQQQPSAPPKRGQKAKLKKIREKYRDQDEEERRLRMDILQSSGPVKEKEIKKKGKKGKQLKQQQQQQQKQEQQQKQQQRPKGGFPQGHPGRPLTIDDITVNTMASDSQENVPKKKREEDDGNESDEEKAAILEDENIIGSEDAGIVDSLTGQPLSEDVMLFSVPVCAPYSVLNNYKFKVKLTPGSQRRGKAAKTALNMFFHEKSTSSREKELLRCVKDTDLSRNMPGKVKVSAPNLHAHKQKKK